MRLRWVLLLSDRYAELYQLGKGNLLLQQQFEQTEAGIKTFASWLAQNSIKTPVAILLDLREEAYQVEQVPHVSFYDRKPLLQHRLQRLFKTENYRYAQIQGKTQRIIDPKETLRKDDCVLFTAINQTDQLKPWIKQLLSYNVPIRGIHSLPLLVNHLLPHLGEYSLVLTPSNTLQGDLHLGVRQFFFKHGRLLFSRLLALPNDTPLPTYLDTLQDKIKQTIQYLRGARLLMHQEKVQIYILGSNDFLSKIRPEIASKAIKDYQYLSFSELSISQELKGSNIQNFYFRHLVTLYLGTHRVPNHYASLGEQQYFNYWLWQRSLYIASSLCFILALGFASEHYYQAFLLKQKIQKIQTQTSEQHKRYLAAQSQQKQLLGLSMEVIHIKNSVDSFIALQSQYTPMQPYLLWLSHYLNNFPRLYIEEIDWKIIQIKTPDQPKTALSNFEKRAEKKRRNDNKADNSYYHVQLSLHGHLQPYDGNSTAALRTVNRFIEQLKQDQKVIKIDRKELPLSVDPSQSLDGVVAEQNQSHDKANFQLDILFQTIQTTADNQFKPNHKVLASLASELKRSVSNLSPRKG